ncbi:amino acid ABC transporter permease [Nocardioides sp. Soil805]|uniref:amino acid ABC transporter permease n=1 Tax=Nocardioides sp. Soil805 TaxID=1736416 RepID=UPI000702D936|nr:amino acid ABC transporter permease [Nocardioides sp. Soil805]KRF34919.1 amino acid ABC transporter permease [Nocardioides sp. Soil805]
MDALTQHGDLIAEALGTTLLIAVLSTVGALVIGVLVTVARISPVPVLRGAAFCYVQYFLNVPLLALLLLAVFALPDAGLVMPLTTTVVVVLGLYEGAYVAEAVRSGVNTVAPGEVEAARALGMGFSQVMRKIVVPQALRAVVQPLGNVLIALLMNTALAATVGVVELTSAANRINNVLAQPIAVYASVGVVYMAMALGLGLMASRVEKRVAILR